jgi:endonuclease/exonuclease/phosphatase (EEP) superfamily protein YafD
VAAYARSASGPTLIAGDFNTTQWSGHFKDMIRDSGLSVCARGHAIALSWPAQFIPLGISIDHCLSSDHWRSLEIRTGPRLGSDHLALVVDLHLDR